MRRPSLRPRSRCAGRGAATPTVAALAAAALLTAACSDPSGPRKTEPRIRVVAGAGIVDTVLTAPVQAVVVEVRDTLGKPVGGAIVRFRARPSPIATRRYETPLFVCPVTQPSCGPNSFSTFAVDTSRDDGRATIAVALGTVAGPTWLDIEVPALGARDSAAFTVLPGNAARVTIAVEDTAVYVGGAYDLHAAVADQFGNPRAGEVPDFAADVPVTVSAAGRVTGASYGRARIIASRQRAADTAFVSVVPAGHVVTYRTYGSAPSALAEFNLDGSGYKVRASMTGNNSGFTSWFANGDALYHDGDAYDNPQLYRATPSGTVTLFLRDPAPPVTRFAQPSRNGAWVYFTGGGGSYAPGLYRARGDGTGVEAVAGGEDGSMPAPSPDGSRVAFVRGGALNVLTVATGTVVDLGISATFPRWSPTGDMIAFTRDYEAGVHVVNADGTNARIVGGVYASIWLDWSPDAQWIVISEAGQIALLRVSTGERLPLRLPSVGQHYQPSWR